MGNVQAHTEELQTMMFQSPVDKNHQDLTPSRMTRITSVECWHLGNLGTKKLVKVAQELPPSPYAPQYVIHFERLITIINNNMCTAAGPVNVIGFLYGS